MTPTERITRAQELIGSCFDYPSLREVQSLLAAGLNDYTPAQESLAQELYNRAQSRLRKL